MDLSFRNYFKEAVRDQLSVGLYTGYYSKKIGFYFALPVKNDDGIVGVLAFKLLPEKVQNTLAPDGAGGEALNIMLVDSDGIVDISNNKEQEYKSLGQLSQEKRNAIINDHRLDGVVSGVENLNYDQVQQVLGSMSSTQIFEYSDKNTGVMKIAGAARISSYPFYVVLEEGLASFNSSSLKLAISIAAIILASSIVMLIAVYWLVNRFLKPIPELINYTETIGRGKFDARIESDTGDELDELIGNLNEMAGRLEAYYKLLQSQIKIKSGDVQRKIDEIELKNKQIAEIRGKLHNLLKERK